MEVYRQYYTYVKHVFENKSNNIYLMRKVELPFAELKDDTQVYHPCEDILIAKIDDSYLVFSDNVNVDHDELKKHIKTFNPIGYDEYKNLMLDKVISIENIGMPKSIFIDGVKTIYDYFNELKKIDYVKSVKELSDLHIFNTYVKDEEHVFFSFLVDFSMIGRNNVMPTQKFAPTLSFKISELHIDVIYLRNAWLSGFIHPHIHDDVCFGDYADKIRSITNMTTPLANFKQLFEQYIAGYDPNDVLVEFVESDSEYKKDILCHYCEEYTNGMHNMFYDIKNDQYYHKGCIGICVVCGDRHPKHILHSKSCINKECSNIIRYCNKHDPYSLVCDKCNANQHNCSLCDKKAKLDCVTCPSCTKNYYLCYDCIDKVRLCDCDFVFNMKAICSYCNKPIDKTFWFDNCNCGKGILTCVVCKSDKQTFTCSCGRTHFTN